MSIAMIFICLLFEKGKREKLKKSYLLSKTEENNNTQISELLRLFQDGLIIIDQKFNLQYNNETANKLIKRDNNSFMDELQIIKFQDGKLIIDALHSIQFESNHVSISLGIAEINNLLYE